jgi:drug/metabolite transporter (DMT)-like permease
MIGPPLAGAFLLTSMVALRVVALATSGGRAENGEDVDTAFAFAAVGGAVCGLAYSLVGRRLRTRGALGNYLAGIVTVAPYFAFLFFLFPDPAERASVTDPFWLWAWLIVSTIAGVVLGREFHEKDNLLKPSSGGRAT